MIDNLNETFQSAQESSSAVDESLTEETPLSPKQSLDNAFTIKDLSSLLKNLEAEIALNEQHINDENDKRYMFKVSRRNVTNFSSMKIIA